MAINKVWHEKHKLAMPTTLPERVKWHVAHLKHCKDMPKTIMAELHKQGKKVCTRGHIYEASGACPLCWPGQLKK